MCKVYKSLKTVNLTGTGRFSVNRSQGKNISPHRCDGSFVSYTLKASH